MRGRHRARFLAVARSVARMLMHLPIVADGNCISRMRSGTASAVVTGRLACAGTPGAGGIAGAGLQGPIHVWTPEGVGQRPDLLPLSADVAQGGDPCGHGTVPVSPQ